MNNILDELIKDIESSYEVERAENLAIYLRKKYKNVFEIDESKDDPNVVEFLDCLEELGNISNLISLAFKTEITV